MPSALTETATGTSVAPTVPSEAPVAVPEALAEPPLATDEPVLTSAGTGMGWSEPHPEPVIDAADCASRWNAPTNAAGRAEAAAAQARGAFVLLRFDGEERCAVWFTAGGGLMAFPEVSAGSLRPHGRRRLRVDPRPPDWYVQPDGSIEGPLDPPPPRASFSSAGRTATAGVGSFCWTSEPDATMCGDSAAPFCGDGFTPQLDVTAGVPVGLALAFEPVDAPALTVFASDGQAAGEPVALERSPAPSWAPELTAGKHALMVFVRAPDAQDVSYTVCLNVSTPTSTVPYVEPIAALSAPSVPRADITAHMAVDQAECAERWNAPANAEARERWPPARTAARSWPR